MKKLRQMDIYECIAIAEERKKKMADKKVSPTQTDAKKLSQARKSLFQAGFMSGMAYRGSPKYDYTDPMTLFKAMETCDKMFELMDGDEFVVHNGKDQVQSIARILGLADEPKK